MQHAVVTGDMSGAGHGPSLQAPRRRQASRTYKRFIYTALIWAAVNSCVSLQQSARLLSTDAGNNLLGSSA